MPLNYIEAEFLGIVFEALFYGLYCIIFALYLRVHKSKKSDDRSLLVYPISFLFLLSSAFFAVNLAQDYLIVADRQLKYNHLVWNLNLMSSLFYTLVDVTAQGVLIYRCWIVWDRKLAVVIIPSILLLISLGTSLSLVIWLAAIWPHVDTNAPQWYTPIGILSFTLSLTVNAIFTGLLVYKISKTSLAFRSTHARAYTPLISILIESGLIFFVAQLIWIICFSLPATTNASSVVAGSIAIIYGIIPTAIMVRISMASPVNTVSRGLTVESAIEFRYTDDTANSPTISTPREPKSSPLGQSQSMSSNRLSA